MRPRLPSSARFRTAAQRLSPAGDLVGSRVVVASAAAFLTRGDHPLIARWVDDVVTVEEDDIAEATVKVHVKSLLKKLRMRSRVEAAVWAVENIERNSPSGTLKTS